MPDLKFQTGNEGEKAENYIKESFHYKGLIRDAVYKTVLISGTILGFSISLFSTTFFKASIEIILLRHSWYYFFAAIVSGVFYLLVESRISYTRVYQDRLLHRQAGAPKSKSPIKSFFMSIWISLVSLLVPTSRTFGSWSSDGPKGIRVDARRKAVTFFSWLEEIMSILEIAVFFLFAAGLFELIRAFH